VMTMVAPGVGRRTARCRSESFSLARSAMPKLRAPLWTAKKRLGLILLSISMFRSLLFGLYHHFLVVSPDHIHSQPSGGWGTTFALTAYLLLIMEAIGTYVGVHFLWIAEESPLQR